MIIKMADINTPTKCYSLHRAWSERITEEFYQQVGVARCCNNYLCKLTLDQIIQSDTDPKFDLSEQRSRFKSMCVQSCKFHPFPFLLPTFRLRKKLSWDYLQQSSWTANTLRNCQQFSCLSFSTSSLLCLWLVLQLVSSLASWRLSIHLAHRLKVSRFLFSCWLLEM